MNTVGGRGGGDRGVSDLIGFVLVFSLIVSVVGVVSVVGMDSLQETRDAETLNNAERAFEVLSNNMADIYDREAPSRATEISLEDASMHMGDPVTIEVSDGGSTLHESTARPIVYDNGDTEIVYVMGAVFRDQRQGGTVLESWSPVLGTERTFVPIVNTTSGTGDAQSMKSSTVLVRAEAVDRKRHVVDNAGSYDDVWINVTTQRQDLWHRMLDDHDELDCTTVGSDRVECELLPTTASAPQQLYVVETRIDVMIKL